MSPNALSWQHRETNTTTYDSREKNTNTCGEECALAAQLVEGVLEEVLAAHVDAQRAVVTVAAGAHLVAEEEALVVKVNQARRAHELRQRALQQQLHVLLNQHVHQLPVPLCKPARHACRRF